VTLSSHGVGLGTSTMAGPPRRSDGTIFECRDLKVIFQSPEGPRPVLDRVTFDVHDGEFLSIMGRSGTGKSTLLRVLGGLLVPEPGSVVNFRGVRVERPPEGVVFVFQNYAATLLSWRTIGKNVALGLEGRLSKDEIRDRVQETLAMVGLADRAGDYPWQLSGGMQQRVQLARALALRASVILMDEPFGSLDAITRSGLQDELQRIQQQTHTTVVFVTHDIDEAVYLSDRILLLEGSPATVPACLEDELPRPRHQLGTRELADFARLRRVAYEQIAVP
jgi:NitT/TauT family transport system ATP-binding protein